MLDGGWEVLTRQEDFGHQVALVIVRRRSDGCSEAVTSLETGPRHEYAGREGRIVTATLKRDQALPEFVLPRQVVAALVRGLMEHTPPDGAQAAHLKDALAIRDRVLALVERQFDVGVRDGERRS